MGAESHLGAIARNHSAAVFFFGDISDDLDALYGADLVVVSERHGEKQLVVFAAVKGSSDQVHIDFLCHHSGLVVDGNAVLVDAAAAVALLADVEQL